jgi:hypothetical protein
MSFKVSEQCTAKIKGVLRDEDGAAIDGATITSLGLTLYDKVTGNIINSRDHLNILNVNGGSVDSVGNFAWIMTPSDNMIVNDSLNNEEHHALIEFTYSGGRQGKKLVVFVVENLVKVPGSVPPPGSLTLGLSPTNTLFVSPGFAGQSAPYYTTIQAAVDAADGVTTTTILIYPGTYAENVLIAKQGVSLCGVGDREKVIISGTVNTSPIVSLVVTEQTPSLMLEYFLTNLTVKNLSAGFKGLQVTTSNSPSNTFYLRLRGVSIYTSDIALLWIGGVVGTDVEVWDCFIRSNAASLDLTDAPIIKWFNCRIRGGTQGQMDSTVVSANGMEFQGCRIEQQMRFTGGGSPLIRYMNCAFTTATPFAFPVGYTPGSVIIVVRGCVGKGSSKFIDVNDTGGATVSFYIEGCAFELSTSSGTILGGGGGNVNLFVRSCHINHRIVNFQTGGIGGVWKISCVNVDCENFALVNVFEGAVAYSVFLWGFVSNAGYNAGFVTIRPNSANYAFSITDVNGW